MHKLIHEIIAAIGGIMFIVIGVGRQRERRHLISTGKKAEGAGLWSMLIITGVCLIVFAVGLIIFQVNQQ